MSYIKQRMPVDELLAGLAEECSELSQASLKLRRVLNGQNPTPTPYEEAKEHFFEEVADVQLYLKQIDIPWNYIKKIGFSKQKRWEERLNGESKAT